MSSSSPLANICTLEPCRTAARVGERQGQKADGESTCNLDSLDLAGKQLSLSPACATACRRPGVLGPSQLAGSTAFTASGFHSVCPVLSHSRRRLSATNISPRAAGEAKAFNFSVAHPSGMPERAQVEFGSVTPSVPWAACITVRRAGKGTPTAKKEMNKIRASAGENGWSPRCGP